MADKQTQNLDTTTPTLDDVTVSFDYTSPTELKKTTWQLVRDLFKTYFDTIYQAVLVSWTNIKTINSVTVLGSWDITIPALTDGDKGDITVSSSGTVWNIDNNVVTNAKQATMATASFKWRTTAWTGNVEDLTGTQATALLNEATTSLKGLMSSSDKTKLDWLGNEWTLDKSSSFTAGGTYDSSTLTSYNLYKVVITWTSTGWSTFIPLRLNNDSGWSSYTTYYVTWSTLTSATDSYFQVCNHNSWSWYPFYVEIIIPKEWGYNYTLWNGMWPGNIYQRWIKSITVTSMQFPFITAISWTIKIYGKNL